MISDDHHPHLTSPIQGEEFKNFCYTALSDNFMFKYFLYKFGQFILSWAPPVICFKWAKILSDLHYYFSCRDRRAVGNNLRIILKSEENIPALTKQVFRNFGRYLVEFFMMGKMVNEAYLKKNVKMNNIERVSQVLKEGKGGIVITAHLGNWEMGAAILTMLGYPLVAIALPHKERPVNDLFNHQRQVKGMTVIPTHMAFRRCLEKLKENKLIALVADRDFSLNGEPMDFLGRKTLIPAGPAVFSLITGAPIIPTFLIRDQDGTFTLSVCEPLYPPSNVRKEDEKRALLGIIKQYISVIEEKIYLYPTQWLMFREFWIKDIPPQSALRRIFRFKRKVIKKYN